MQIWASSLDGAQDPPFADKGHLYDTIDATLLGDVQWQSFSVSYAGELGDGEVAPWKTASYDVWYRDPHEVLKSQLSNPDFANEMDFAPKEVRDVKTGRRRFQDFMSGCFSWRKAVSTFFFSSYQVLICPQDKIAENLTNHGATLCPIILGSDKTTVSVATGHNEYYPLYMSNGLIHNNVRRAHRDGVTLIAFLAIPKSKDFVIGYCLLIEFYLVLQADREHHDSKEFRQFRRNLFHGSIRAILQSLGPGMAAPEIIRFADGHFRRVIYELGPYIADYPEQVLCACIVQGWCSRFVIYSNSICTFGLQLT
jgi:hypothetical protein